MKMTIEREGLKFALPLLAAGVFGLFLFWPLGIFLLLLGVAVALFFRETVAGISFAPGQIVSPASGRVIEIRETEETEFLRGSARRVAIFMSILDEHVNYSPVAGVVAHLRHRPGSFHRAFLDRAGEANEAVEIGLSMDGKAVLMRQIAGIIARRIVCRVRPGQLLAGGEKLGLIRFGSRVDLYLPREAVLRVRTGEKVRGGQTVLGELR